MTNRARRAITFCEPCGKRSYVSRKDARKVARIHEGHKSPYECPVNPNYWHIGQLWPTIVAGEETRDQVAARSRRRARRAAA